MTILILGLGANLGAADLPAADVPATPDTKAVFLHYRLRKDGSLALISRQEIPAKLKPSRSAANRAREAGRRNPSVIAGLGGGPVYLSYALISARGDTLSETTLPDPRIRRVEWQEKGMPGLSSHTVVQDSGDIFLRISEPEARSLRFFRWRPLAPQGALPGSTGISTGATGALAKPSGASSEATVIKVPMAEFALP